MARKKTENDEGSGADIGVVMTCSLFLIILTFFILLNSIAVIDDRKQRLAIGSLVGSFGSLTGGLSPLNTGSSIMPSSAPVAKQEMNFKKFLAALDAQMLDNIQVATKMGRGIISVNAGELFDEATHVIKPSQKMLMDELSAFINKGHYPVAVIGHTDNRPAEEKGYSSNWEATSIMAITVLRYLVENGGLNPERITAYGRGSQVPIASNDTVESRRLNRRVEIELKFNMPDYVRKLYEERPAGNFTYKRFNFKVF
jgi:chemotaxis protein MotB